MAVNFDSLFDGLKKAIGDFSSLEVATFTKPKEGDAANQKVQLDLSSEEVSANDIFKQIRAQLNNEELVGYVKFEVDGDTVAYVNSDEAFAEALKYHQDMIAAGQQTRKNIYDTVVGLFKKGS